RLVDRPPDERSIARLLIGIALIRLGQVDRGLAILAAAYRSSKDACATIRAELALNLGIGHFRRRELDVAARLFKTVPRQTDILYARALERMGGRAHFLGDFVSRADMF